MTDGDEQTDDYLTVDFCREVLEADFPFADIQDNNGDPWERLVFEAGPLRVKVAFLSVGDVQLHVHQRPINANLMGVTAPDSWRHAESIEVHDREQFVKASDLIRKVYVRPIVRLVDSTYDPQDNG